MTLGIAYGDALTFSTGWWKHNTLWQLNVIYFTVVYFLPKATILMVKSQYNVVPILAWYKKSLKVMLGHFQQGGENFTLWDN